jgi:hypothetical protein
LQEVYLIADYERRNFYLIQARYDPRQKRERISIPSLLYQNVSVSNGRFVNDAHRLPVAAIIGIDCKMIGLVSLCYDASFGICDVPGAGGSRRAQGHIRNGDEANSQGI